MLVSLRLVHPPEAAVYRCTSPRLPLPPDPAALPAAWRRQAQFRWMQHSFGMHGGLLRQPDPPAPAPHSPGAVAFHWQGTWWLPGFQFEAGSQAPWQGLPALCADLPPSSDAWDIACWLAMPHPALGGHPPVALLPTHLATVRDAARIERFLVSG